MTHVIIHVLPSDMDERLAETSRRHAHSIVRQPQRRPKTVANAGEAAAARRVRLEHDERLASGMCDPRGVDIRRDDRQDIVVAEVVREDGLGDLRGAEGVPVMRGAVVVWVAIDGGESVSNRGRTETILTARRRAPTDCYCTAG